MSEIEFTTRKWVRPEDLNANGTLFGGSLLKWIDEEATIYAILQLGNRRVVTKIISEINFVASAVEHAHVDHQRGEDEHDDHQNRHHHEDVALVATALPRQVHLSLPVGFRTA